MTQISNKKQRLFSCNDNECYRNPPVSVALSFGLQRQTLGGPI